MDGFFDCHVQFLSRFVNLSIVMSKEKKETTKTFGKQSIYFQFVQPIKKLAV